MPTIKNPNAPLYGDYRDFSRGGRYGPTGANAPVQTGREGGRNQFDYWDTRPDRVNAYLLANQNDPKIRAAAARGSQALDRELHSRGYRVPEHYKAGVDATGRLTVKEMSWWDKHSNWAVPAIGMGLAIGMGPLVNAISGGGAPATTATTATAGGGGPVGTGGTLASSQIGTGYLPAIGTTTGTATALASRQIGNGYVPGIDAPSRTLDYGNLPSGANTGGGNTPNLPRNGFDWGRLLDKGLPAGLLGLGQMLAPGPPELPQELRDILNMQKQRMQAQDPLYASILRLAQQRLPTSVQGAQLPASASPAQQQIMTELARRRQG